MDGQLRTLQRRSKGGRHVLLSVGSQPVATLEEAAQAIGRQDSGKQAVALRVLRDGHSLFVAVPDTVG